jgi:hypothetical protein
MPSPPMSPAGGSARPPISRVARQLAGVGAQAFVGFADELRVGLRGMVRCAWSRRGVKVYQRPQLTYKGCYLFLVVDEHAGKLHWSWVDAMAGEQFEGAVGRLHETERVRALVGDGGPVHRD